MCVCVFVFVFVCVCVCVCVCVFQKSMISRALGQQAHCKDFSTLVFISFTAQPEMAISPQVLLYLSCRW